MEPSATTLDEAVVRALTERLQANHRIAAAYLIGSGAEGRLRAESDVDIAVLPARGTTLTVPERMDLAADLAALAGRTVDLGILQTGNLVYAKEVMRPAHVLGEVFAVDGSVLGCDKTAAPEVWETDCWGDSSDLVKELICRKEFHFVCG